VKDVEYIEDTRGLITKKIKPNFKVLGKKYGKQMKEISAAFAAISQDQITEIETGELFRMELPGGIVEITPADVEITSEDMPGWLVASEGKLTVALDITITDSLRREGVARELVNRIQNLRKDSGFEVTDKIMITLESRQEIEDALCEYKDYICSQTLAKGLTAVPGFAEGEQIEWEEGTLTIAVEKI